eukprot:5753186-Prymnesium_polylepis.1
MSEPRLFYGRACSPTAVAIQAALRCLRALSCARSWPRWAPAPYSSTLHPSRHGPGDRLSNMCMCMRCACMHMSIYLHAQRHRHVHVHAHVCGRRRSATSRWSPPLVAPLPVSRGKWNFDWNFSMRNKE